MGRVSEQTSVEFVLPSPITFNFVVWKDKFWNCQFGALGDLVPVAHQVFRRRSGEPVALPNGVAQHGSRRGAPDAKKGRRLRCVCCGTCGTLVGAWSHVDHWMKMNEVSAVFGDYQGWCKKRSCRIWRIWNLMRTRSLCLNGQSGLDTHLQPSERLKSYPFPLVLPFHFRHDQAAIFQLNLSNLHEQERGGSGSLHKFSSLVSNTQ